MVKGFEITQFESLKIKKIESSGIKVIISYESLENKQPWIISSIWNFKTILNIKDIDKMQVYILLKNYIKWGILVNLKK